MKFKMSLAVAAMYGLLSVDAMPVQAAPYGGSWTATDDSIFAVDFAVGADGYFFLYDRAGDGPTDKLNVFVANSMFDDVYFTRDSGKVLHASLTAHDTSSSSVALAGSSFGFFFSQLSDGSAPMLSYDVQQTGEGSFRLTSISNPVMSVIVHDVSPVPLPAAIWLLGSGVVALAGLKKRKREDPL